MDKRKSNELVYYIKVDSDEETKNKKKKNKNNNQDSYQNNNKKVFYSKKQKIDEDNCKSKINSGQINDDTSPTKETLNTPSDNKNNNKSKDNEKEKEKLKNKTKNNNIKLTSKVEKYEEDIIDRNNKNKGKKYRYDTLESFKKTDNDDDLVTSFERKPSELKSPKTISENSFTSSYEEEEISKKYEKKNNKDKSNKKDQKNKEKNKKGLK